MIVMRFILLIALLAGLGGWAYTPASASPAAQAGPTASLTPLRGPAGTTVLITASGFPPNSQVDIGAGRVETEYTVLTTARADAQGTLTVQTAIPDDARPGEIWVMVAALSSDPSVRAVSNVFAVTDSGPEGSATYIVRPGDYLSLIAERFGTTVAALLEANPDLSDPRLIHPGQALVIPAGASAQPELAISPLRGPAGTLVTLTLGNFPPNTPVEITVGELHGADEVADSAHATDDTGSLTARVPIPADARADQLWVVEAATASGPEIRATSPVFAVVSPAEGRPPFTYIVQPGDSLWRIARRFGTTLVALIQANPQITDPRLIFPGQELAIPGGADVQPSVSISPLRGPAGTPVQVSVSGFPPATPVSLGVGVLNAEPAVTYAGQSTDDHGRLNSTVAIPPEARPDELWVVLVRTTRGATVSELSNTFAVTQPAAGQAVFTSVPVYLVDLGQGQIGCGDGLKAVARSIAATDQPVRAALEELLAEPDAGSSRPGLYNALARSDLRVESVEVDELGQATLQLAGDFRIGGMCDEPRVRAQLEQTALQFSPVRSVTILINGQPLETLLGGAGH